MKSKKKIGFIIEDQNSIGVTNLILNLARFINKFHGNNYQSIIFSEKKINENIYNLEYLNLRNSFFLKKNFLTKIIIKIINKFFKLNYPIDYLIDRYDIDLLSHSSHIPQKKIPLIFWIPDFQFIYYPKNFNKELTKIKIKNYKNLFNVSKFTILSSYSALNDARDVFKNKIERNKKFRVINFKPEIKKPNKSKNIELNRKYRFKNFFYVPNHLWIHKNFECIVNALIILKDKNIHAKIVSSGSTYDYRNPGYFKKIKHKIEKNNLDITFLNELPQIDKNFLFLKSLAIINPSYFEGWSTIVEEAKYFNKNIILSNIPVHKEQNPPNCKYFNPKNPKNLAKLIALYLKKRNKTKFNKLKLLKDQKNYTQKYISLVKKII